MHGFIFKGPSLFPEGSGGTDLGGVKEVKWG